MPDPTTNFGWDVPTVGGDSGAWGTILNTLFNDIDTDLKSVQDMAKMLIGALSTSGTVTINLATNRYFTITPAGTVTFAFSNVPAGSTEATGVIIRISNSGGHTINWPASVDWPGGSAPSVATSGTHLVMLVTDDGGTTWRGNALLSFS